MVRTSCLDNAFSGILELEASPVEGQQHQPKDTCRRKRKCEKKIKKGLNVGCFRYILICVHVWDETCATKVGPLTHTSVIQFFIGTI